MDITTREDVAEFELVSLDGRDMVTLDINGRLFDMPSAVATALANDIKRAVKRAKGGK